MTELARDQYEAICERAPDAILIVDSAGTITYANARVEDHLGYAPAELLGEPVERLLPEDLQEGHVAQRDAYIADPEARPMGADVDLEARRKDGTRVPVDISLSPVGRDEDGVHVMAVVRDISERERLRQKYRTILESVPDPVVIADVGSGEIVEANAQVGELWGYDPDELVGEHQTSLHPTGEQRRYRELFERHASALSARLTQFPDGSDIEIETADGRRIPVEVNASVFELDDAELLVGVFRDIRTRRSRERQLKELNETTQRLIEAQDPAEVAQLVADSADAILGYGSTVVRLVEDGSRLEPVAVSAQAKSTLGQRPDYAVDGANPASRAYREGEPRQIEDLQSLEDEYDRGEARSAMYLPLGEHGVLSVVDPEIGAFDQSDVEFASILAANAKTALDRVAYERELERQNTRLDEFAGIVSHDLRNPLQVADGWLEAIDDADAPEEIERVGAALERMEAIIEDTLTLAQQGATVSAEETVDVGTLVDRCWQMVSTGDATLEVADAFTVRGDRERLQHVFENLFRNAVEHGGEDVTVTVGRVDGGFYVEDDGPGIPEGERESVFDSGHTTNPDGTGFGLSIVREIAKAHGWDVNVTEGSDGGARFEFTNVEFG